MVKEEVTGRTGRLPAADLFIVEQSHMHRMIRAVLKCFIAGSIVQWPTEDMQEQKVKQTFVITN